MSFRHSHQNPILPCPSLRSLRIQRINIKRKNGHVEAKRKEIETPVNFDEGSFEAEQSVEETERHKQREQIEQAEEVQRNSMGNLKNVGKNVLALGGSSQWHSNWHPIRPKQKFGQLPKEN